MTVSGGTGSTGTGSWGISSVTLAGTGLEECFCSVASIVSAVIPREAARIAFRRVNRRRSPSRKRSRHGIAQPSNGGRLEWRVSPRPPACERCHSNLGRRISFRLGTDVMRRAEFFQKPAAMPTAQSAFVAWRCRGRCKVRGNCRIKRRIIVGSKGSFFQDAPFALAFAFVSLFPSSPLQRRIRHCGSAT